MPPKPELVPGTYHREHGRPEVVWDIEGLQARGLVATWAGYPGAGKTPTVLQKVRALLGGRPDFLDYPITPVPDEFRVIYLTEESNFLFPSMLDAAGLSNDDLARFDIAYWDRNWQVPWPDMVGEMVHRLNGCGLLIVDTAPRWAGVYSENAENDSSVMSGVYGPLVQAAGTGIAVDVLGHTTKTVPNLRSDRDFNIAHVRGSGAVVASSTLVFGLKVPRESGRREDQRYFTVLRDKTSGRQDAFYTRLEPSGLVRLGNMSALAADRPMSPTERVLDAVDIIVTNGAAAASGTEVARVAGMNKKAALETLKDVADDGWLVRSNGGWVRSGSGSRNSEPVPEPPPLENPASD